MPPAGAGSSLALARPLLLHSPPLAASFPLTSRADMPFPAANPAISPTHPLLYICGARYACRRRFPAHPSLPVFPRSRHLPNASSSIHMLKCARTMENSFCVALPRSELWRFTKSGTRTRAQTGQGWVWSERAGGKRGAGRGCQWEEI